MPVKNRTVLLSDQSWLLRIKIGRLPVGDSVFNIATYNQAESTRQIYRAKLVQWIKCIKKPECSLIECIRASDENH